MAASNISYLENYIGRADITEDIEIPYNSPKVGELVLIRVRKDSKAKHTMSAYAGNY
jgi:hypothetical protein